MFVDGDTKFADGEASYLCECSSWTIAHGNDNEFGRNGVAVSYDDRRRSQALNASVEEIVTFMW